MRIYSMTATFGKLSHQTLTFEPGLNIIQAPNEWGKSTWCAFLVAMLYGIDTRQQTTKSGLADKERYRPWSGEAMSGRMELNWNGKDITIERSTKGRIPFGEFRAYETETGLDVPELTAQNCGQVLLGVERSVFTRAGFIRLQDMPVTQDESLRRRLNNLVTTGDESGAGDTLGKQLKDLKNKVRYNRSGLLPQAEYDREQLRSQLQQRQELQAEITRIQNRQAQLEEEVKLLNNHADTLRYEAAKQGVLRIRQAEEACLQLQAEVNALEASCKELPAPEEAEKALQQGNELLSLEREIAAQKQLLPPAPIQPEVPAQYAGVSPEEAIASAKVDYVQYLALQGKQKNQAKLPLFFGIFAAIALMVMVILNQPITYLAIGIGLVLAGILVLALSVGNAAKNKAALEKLCGKYPGVVADGWVAFAQRYAQAQEKYALALEQYAVTAGSADSRQAALEQQIRDYAAEESLAQRVSRWQNILEQYQLLSAKVREYQNATEHAAALQSVATTAPAPAFADTLTHSLADTESRLQQCSFELRQLHIQLGQNIGQAEALGQEDNLRARLDGVNRRINRLEEHYRALELAQEVLYQASTSLQRRFAPRISKRAQDYFSQLTHGRYQRISLSDDLSISASAENEDTLHSSAYRSDGTVDQLYLSLRLAVAGEITPNAPLVLDDALVRFDDDRLKSALELLSKEAEEKQVIVFTCQGREKDLLG